MQSIVSKLKVFAFGLALLSLMALGSGLAFGQAISGNIVGTVVDSSGAVVTNASVEATNVGTGVTTEVRTGASGGYRFENLPSGTYKITAKASGFRTVTQQADVELNKTGTVNVTMSPGATTETIEVSGAAPIIDTTTAQIQTTYDSTALQNLPTTGFGVSSNGQNLGVLNLSLLQSGVGSSGGLGAGTGPSVSGQRPRNNNFTIEGVDNNDKSVTGPLAYVPAEAVENFSVLQNQFSPEFGHSTGGQFNQVVRSGTNGFHGMVYESFQNKNLNAIDQSIVGNTPVGQTPKNPRFDENRYGGQLGGPIFKNKLFFFVNYERNPLGQVTVLSQPILAPTVNGYNTLAGLAGVSANNVNTLKQFVVAPSACSADQIAATTCPGTSVSVNGTPVEIGVFPVVGPAWRNFNSLTTSMDYNISGRDQLRGRYIHNIHSFIDNTPNLPVFYNALKQPFHLVTLSEYHTFSPSVTNEVRVGYNRTGLTTSVPDKTFPGLDAFPNITIDELNNINVGPDPNGPQYTVQNLYSAVDNLTWTKGVHTLKFGIEGRKYISPQKFIQRSRGDYEWSTFEAYVDDLTPDFAERSFGNVGYSGDQYAVYWYVSDTWRVRPNLSLNLGLRYEFTSTPFGWTQQNLNSLASVPGLITFAAPKAPKKDFMPRLGFAYSPGGGNTSIRGGFGLGYDVLYDNIGVLSRPPQIGSTIDCPDDTNPLCAARNTNFLAQGGIPPQSLSGITVYDAPTARSKTAAFLPQDVSYPYAITWNLGVQRVFAKDYTAEVRYVGTRGVDLNVQNRLNIQDVVTPSQFLPTYLQAPSQATLDALPTTLAALKAMSHFVPAFEAAGFTTNIVGFVPFGSSTYHGLQAQLNRRFSNGLLLQAAYTYSHNIDNSTADFFSTIITPRRPQDFRDLNQERSNSALDHRHRLTVSAVYETSWFKGSNWLKRNLLSNYQIAPVYTYESGEWATVQSGVDSNLNGDNAGDRVITNSGGVKGTGSGVTKLTNSSGDVVAYLADNPTAQYIVAGQGALANTARNTLATPYINNWDITVSKHFHVTEQCRVDVFAGLLNAFNHPQFTTGSINQANQISDTTQRNYLIPNASTFNNPRATWPSNARVMSIGMKFAF